jgi:flagellar L-ring protein FlgH
MKSSAFRIIAWVASAGIAALLTGCTNVPSTIVQHPTSTRPQPVADTGAANGAIFQATAYRPLFEDRRARLIGDILTIAINEKTSATKSGGNSASKTSAGTVAIPTVVGLPFKTLQGTALNASTSLKYEEKGDGSASNNFNGMIGVTVVEVLANGNLVVSGEKQVALDKGAEFIRFSGVVSPDTIAQGNVVLSTQVADARVEYRTNSRIDQAEAFNWLARFFYSVMPL